MVRVTVNRGTSTRNVKSGKSKSRRGKPSMRSGRGTISRSSSGTYKKSTAKRSPSMRSGRGTVSRVAKRKSRATGMRAARASGKVKRSGRGYITTSGGSAKKKASARPSMRSGRGTISRSSSGTYKKSTAKRKPSTRSGRGNVSR